MQSTEAADTDAAIAAAAATAAVTVAAATAATAAVTAAAAKSSPAASCLCEVSPLSALAPVLSIPGFDNLLGKLQEWQL